MGSVPKTWPLSPGARAGPMAPVRSSSASRRSSRRMRESTDVRLRMSTACRSTCSASTSPWPVEWIEEPVDRQVKMGTVDEVRFPAKLSAKGKKAKWYMRNQECYKGPKFGFENDEDTFTLIIKKPETGDTGRYTCTVRECNDLSTKAYLE